MKAYDKVESIYKEIQSKLLDRNEMELAIELTKLMSAILNYGHEEHLNGLNEAKEICLNIQKELEV